MAVGPEESKQEESSALRSIIRGPTKLFFEEIWQNACALYTHEIDDGVTSHESSVSASSFDLEQVQASPFQQLLRNGWSSMIQLLENSRQRYFNTATNEIYVPLMFQDGEIVSPELYKHSLFHAYLNGCSIVINHADEACPYLAVLCLDLQKTFPHAYANTYLTPPLSQAVPPHADDRDVLILQIYGKKHWQVYSNIPIPYPYPQEQVGKDGRKVPPYVLNGPCLIDCILQPGDALYMPRGYVHQAHTVSDEPSYHVTIALATHDWTLAGLFTSATTHIVHGNISHRRALPVHLGRNIGSPSLHNDGYCNDVCALQEQLDRLFDELKTQITAQTVIKNLNHRYEIHNNRALPLRQEIINQTIIKNQGNGRQTSKTPTLAAMASTQNTAVVVGPEAATLLDMSTLVRASTVEEKLSLAGVGGPSNGLHVREAIADALMEILLQLKGREGKTCCVKNLRSLVHSSTLSPLLCDLTLLSFAKTCVELGALAIVVS